MDGRRIPRHFGMLAVVLGLVLVNAAVSRAGGPTTYSKAVVIKLTGASNAYDYDNGTTVTATVKFDTTLNYYAASDTFKVSLSLSSAAVGKKVFLKAVLIGDNDNSTTYHFVTDSTNYPVPTIVLKSGTAQPLIENVSKSGTLDVMSFPMATFTYPHPVVLQAEVVDETNRVIGMDAKVVFFNSLDASGS